MGQGQTNRNSYKKTVKNYGLLVELIWLDKDVEPTRNSIRSKTY